MGRPKKVIEPEIKEELGEVAVEEATEVVEDGKEIVLEARGNVNNVPDGYRRVFTDKAEAMAWKEKYNAVEVK